MNNSTPVYSLSDASLHRFWINPFEVIVVPPMMTIEQGDTGKHTIIIDNYYIEQENFSIEVIPDGTPGWSGVV